MFLNDQFYLRKLFLLVICILVIYLYYSSRQFAHRFVFPNNLNVSKRIVNKIRTRTFTDWLRWRSNCSTISKWNNEILSNLIRICRQIFA